MLMLSLKYVALDQNYHHRVARSAIAVCTMAQYMCVGSSSYRRVGERHFHASRSFHFANGRLDYRHTHDRKCHQLFSSSAPHGQFREV